MVGFGAIARTVVQMLAPFGPKVLYYDPFRADSATEEACHAEYAALETIQKCSDILSLHLAVTPQTVNMVDAGFLAGMKDGAKRTAAGKYRERVIIKSKTKTPLQLKWKSCEGVFACTATAHMGGCYCLLLAGGSGFMASSAMPSSFG